MIHGNYEVAANKFEESYNAVFSGTNLSRNVFSFTQRLLGKHEARNFEVLKGNDGTLYLQNASCPTDEKTIEEIADQYMLLKKETENYGGHFMYVQVPYKTVEGVANLKYYSDDTTNQAESTLVNFLKERDVPILDLRVYTECAQVYKTDYHWRVESGFHSAYVLAKHLEQMYDLDFKQTDYYGDTANYESVTYENSFLGSIGIKVGPYFAGKDDFILYKPLFDTDLELQHYIHGELDFEYSGDFWETFIEQSLLDDENYNNKYGALLHGAYVEAVIKNHQASNDYTALIVSHSYGRPLVQYLCLNFKELYHLDPQEGRYNDSYVEYIKEFQPDVVVVMYNDLLNVD